MNSERDVDEAASHDAVAGAARATTRRRRVLAGAGAVAVVAAIAVGSAALGGDDARRPGPVASPSPSASADPAPPKESRPGDLPEWDGTSAPPFYLLLDGRQVRLDPWTSCYTSPPDDEGVSQGACVDGFPAPPFEDVGDRDAVPFAFPLEGWSFEATFSPIGERSCERQVTVPVGQTGDRTFEVTPAGPPGDYQVDVFGRGPEGDAVTSFRWRASEPGPMPEPTGYVGLLTDSGDGIEVYDLELGLRDLGVDPREATATVTVTDAVGAGETYGPVEAEPGCDRDGSLWFRQPSGAPEQPSPTDLGPGPFTYRVELVLDGTTYVGTAVWPRDERPDEAPYTDLAFDPPLPAWTG